MQATLDVVGTVGFYLCWGLALVLPVMCLAATAIFQRQEKFGKWGSQTSRRWLVVGIICAWIVVLLQFALMNYMTDRYDQDYGLGTLILGFSLIPAVMTSVLMFAVWLKHSRQQH